MCSNIQKYSDNSKLVDSDTNSLYASKENTLLNINHLTVESSDDENMETDTADVNQ
jgi:hypothetical protein